MKTRSIAKSFLAIAALTLLVFAVMAQTGRGVRNYDPATEKTVKGTVEEVKEVASKGGRGQGGTHLMVKAGRESWQVDVGPTAFLNKQGFSFAKGNQVEVIGSKVTIEGKQVLIAREVKKEGKTLILRNAQGVPVWSKGKANPN